MTITKLINKKLLLTPSLSQFRGSIAIPEQVAMQTSMCRIIAAGDKCHSILKPGYTVLTKSGFSNRNNLTLGNMFFCEESDVFAIFRNKMIWPIGNKVLIRRDIQETSEHGIVIPENRRFQSLFGTVERFGLSKKPFKYNDLLLGDYIRLKEWSIDMIEIQLEDGDYGLIVDEQDILYKTP